MADNLAKVAKMARVLAIVHIIVGFLLFCFGIADGAVEYFWTGYGWFGIWTGVWGQVIYSANTGYVMTQGPGSVPVAIPMQAGGGMVAVQTLTPGAQGGQPQMVMVPVSGAEDYRPHFVQAAATGAMNTSYQPEQVEMPPPYAQGQYMPQQNEQVKT